MLDEIEVRERLVKKMKRFNASQADKGLIASTVIAGGVSIATFARGVNHLLGKH